MADEITVEYPTKYETEVILKDGSIIFFRPIKRDDTSEWLAFVSKLSRHTKYLRFHHVPREMRMEDAVRFCTVNYKDTFAFIAEVTKEQRRDIVAIGRYYRLPGKRSAEIAVVVDDSYHKKGIGTHLVGWLASVAHDNGITTFEADIQAENTEAMMILRNYGFHITSQLEAGIYHITFPIAPTRRITKKEEERERASTLASLRYLLSPHSVAVIGASRKPNTIGQLLFQCIMQNGFSGIVYPVNPNAEAVMAVKTYPSVLDIPGQVDLAVIAVPAKLVATVADECGRKGVRALVVISDGFRERGLEGAVLEKALRNIALGYGMRLVGPNCMGVLNTDPAVDLNATFSTVYPPRGNVAFLSQSGALGLAILEYASNLNIGISSFVSAGNRADVSSNDLLQYWEQDPATRVILLYLESFGNPHKFGRIARRVSMTKPIVAVKGGSTLAGSRAASSHTGSLATPEIASGALFHQTGMIRVNTLEELFDVATLLSNQPLPRGRRVVIITNGGGPGILAADACEQYGLLLPEFSAETVAQLEAAVKRDIKLMNPLDLTAATTGQEFEQVLKILAGDGGNDAVIAIFIPPTVVDFRATDEAINSAASLFRQQKKPLLVCLMGERGFKKEPHSNGGHVPCYPFPEDAVAALSRASKYSAWLQKPKGIVPKIRGLKRQKAWKLIEAVLSRSSQRPLWLSAGEISQLLDCYGIHFTETLVASTADEAAALASKTGFPVAVKLTSSTIIHKTDVGGVVLNVESEDQVKTAFEDIKTRLSSMGRDGEMEGVSVQRMVKGGVETIVGVTQDPSFGPLIMFGIGGIYAELIKDIDVRLHPLTDLDAEELITSVKMARLFQGFRGSPVSDVEALKDLLLRLSAMIEDIPQIAELDFNPVKVMPSGQGYHVVDARIMVK